MNDCYIYSVRDNDGRKLDHKTLEALRIRAIKQIEAGSSPEQVYRALGMQRSTIYKWLAKYREGGLDALRAKPVPGRPAKLSGSHLAQLYRLVVGNNPQQLQFPFALWTRDMVRVLIRDRFGVRLSEVSVGRLLHKLGLSPQRPVYVAYQQDPERVRSWREQDYPAIRQEAERVGAVIYFGDEAGVRSDFHAGTTWAPLGQTPVVKSTGARFSVNLISAISAQGLLRFMTIQGTLTAPRFIEFCKRLLHDADQPVFLIVDGHRVHRSKAVARFVEQTQGSLRLFFLPPYSPQLNPDEWVWRNVKGHKLGRSVLSGPDDLKRTLFAALRRLQRTPQIVRGFFQDPHTRYAADPLPSTYLCTD